VQRKRPEKTTIKLTQQKAESVVDVNKDLKGKSRAFYQRPRSNIQSRRGDTNLTTEAKWISCGKKSLDTLLDRIKDLKPVVALVVVLPTTQELYWKLCRKSDTQYILSERINRKD